MHACMYCYSRLLTCPTHLRTYFMSKYMPTYLQVALGDVADPGK